MSRGNANNLPEVIAPDDGTGMLVARPDHDLSSDWFAGVPRSTRRVSLVGYFILFAGLASFGAWATTAPIDGAIVAPGVFVATGQNKVIQHLEGGIIREILVREGEMVEEGQSLVVLDDTAAKAELRRLRLREYQLLAQEARLLSEERLEETLNFNLLVEPTGLTEHAHVGASSVDLAAGWQGLRDLSEHKLWRPEKHGAEPEDQEALTRDPPAQTSGLGEDARAILETQRAIFLARQRKLHKEVAILEQTMATHRSREKGDKARLKAVLEQLDVIHQELDGKKKLVNRGLVRKPEYYAVLRAKSKAEGEAAHLEAEIMDSREKIKATQHQIGRVRSIFIQTAVEERLNIGAELKDIRERLIAARSVIERLVVRAPVRGVVVKNNYHTAGGVIKPGNDILALLPLGDELIIEARVKPQDIDNLRKDQKASVRLTALSQRITPIVQGQVIYVSADAVPNEARTISAENVYVARVRLDPGEAEKVPGFVPTPGMPAAVFIKTGERTFFQYLVRPIYDTMARAFREP